MNGKEKRKKSLSFIKNNSMVGTVLLGSNLYLPRLSGSERINKQNR